MNTISTSELGIGGRGYLAPSSDSPLHRCPKCDAYTSHRLPNGKMASQVLFWMPLKRYQCDHCHNKFYILAR
ncbi:hypothetical protein [Pararcticibacter amylolyticus]|uniref:Uncharacterized protein n=1 Tax=Pararcticibacter amylolyticus TaxID=2173175 RepID=A0A2U2PBB9_9SPHI|nr:hypothetical protein [Pararcticibacter amylolyticus]PWG78696.1 hypothetical protein DDR33_20970 [Pararcticibacter amylolyticus]